MSGSSLAKLHILRCIKRLVQLRKPIIGQAAASKGSCLDINPARPHLCVTGGPDAHVCIWDLRCLASPMHEARQDEHGDSSEVGFLSLEPVHNAT